MSEIKRIERVVADLRATQESIKRDRLLIAIDEIEAAIAELEACKAELIPAVESGPSRLEIVSRLMSSTNYQPKDLSFAFKMAEEMIAMDKAREQV